MLGVGRRDVHTNDREISGMHEILCEKLAELSVVGAQELSGIRNQELRARVEPDLRKIAAFQERCP